MNEMTRIPKTANVALVGAADVTGGIDEADPRMRMAVAGKIMLLNPDLPDPAIVIDRTYLIDIQDPSPRRVEARMKSFAAYLDTDQKIIDQFTDPLNWSPISEPKLQVGAPLPLPGSAKTRIDLDITMKKNDNYALVVFRVGREDRFFDLAGTGAELAITAGDATAHQFLFQPQWVNNDHRMVRMIVGGAHDNIFKYSAQYNLGIILKDNIADYYTPIFLDPKIEDSGG